MRQTIKEIEVNVAYRWFLGYGIHRSRSRTSRRSVRTMSAGSRTTTCSRRSSKRFSSI
ncbi:MAG: hypothetical protein MZU97_16645 [Bacillus subtilis]|nr:hypothetical protein [Bacillus subtilis]